MSNDIAAAKKIIQKQLFKAIMAEGKSAKESSWFATNRFADNEAVRTRKAS